MELTPDSADDIEEKNEKKPIKWRNPFSLQQRKDEKERRQKKKARLIIRNISYKSTEEALKNHFEQWGTLEEVKILKRADGKLVGCAFLQYTTVNQATKAILKANKQEFLGRPIYVDWAKGKDEYLKQKVKAEPKEKKPKIEIKCDENEEEEDAGSENENKNGEEIETENSDEENSLKSEVEKEDDASGDGEGNNDSDDTDDSDEGGSATDEDKKEIKGKLQIKNAIKTKHISNDVKEGCTVFIKNVSFDANDDELRKVCRKFGPIHYAIINRERISGHSKGTGFVKFKTKESADLCLQAGQEFVLMDQVLDPTPALSREEIQNQNTEKSKREESKDSRNLYLAREGLIMSGSKAADGVSASDMNKRHKLEQIKTQVLKNLNRFVSRNRLSIHNLPLSYDDEKLRQLAITYTTFKPHECRVMRENQITSEHPKGKSKGFGFMSFKTHQDAINALRKLNNRPDIFGTQHRPIVAFSIEDRVVQNIKDKRMQKSKLSNPTYKEKLEKRKEMRRQKVAGKLNKLPKGAPQSESKEKLKKHIKKLEEERAVKSKAEKSNQTTDEFENYVGMAAKPGTAIRMRSNKKIKEQSQQHMKRVKGEKRKDKQRKIKQAHLAERKAVDRPKQGRKVERDDLTHLVNKYKRMLDSKANEGGGIDGPTKAKKPKRTKWYTEE